MRVELNPLFGKIPANTPNLEVGGIFDRSFAEKAWATVWPGSGLIRWADGSLELETIWRIKKHVEQCGDYQSKWSWFPRQRHGYFFNLSLFWWANYYHWLCDVLPRLHDVLPRLTPDIQVILPPGLTNWQQRTLDWIGLPKNQCVQYSEKRPWKVERLLYVSPVVMSASHEPKTLFWTRERILQNCLGKGEVPLGKRRLYVSRQRALRRKIVNESELWPILEKHGFERVECEALNFEEQVCIFSEASMVVGPHGAGMTNMLWCGRPIKFFEIFEPGSVRVCFWSLAHTLGHDYSCCVADKVSNNGDEPNMSVNPRNFESALKCLCSG